MWGLWRSYSINYAAKRSGPGVVLKEADSKNHSVVGNVSCSKPACLTMNCAQPNSVCDLSTSAKKAGIWGSSYYYTEKYKTHVVGNLTHRPPLNRENICINKKLDYHKRPRSQYLVVEKDVPQVDKLIIHSEASLYVQSEEHHDVILNTKLSDGDTLTDKIINK